jgi:hypothetical protein
VQLLVHDWVAALQTSTLWHRSVAGQVAAVAPLHAAPAVQTPFAHVSLLVKELPSLHALPSAFAGGAGQPVDGLHVAVL